MNHHTQHFHVGSYFGIQDIFNLTINGVMNIINGRKARRRVGKYLYK